MKTNPEGYPCRAIESYVRERWRVSTAWRRSSACMNSPPWYYETIVWEWDPATNTDGELLSCEGSSIDDHFKKCAELFKLAEDADREAPCSTESE